MNISIINVLKLLDKKICYFLGLKEESQENSFKPLAIIKKASKIYVMMSTEPYRRFHCKCGLTEFMNNYLKYLSPKLKRKFGKAAGEAMASNLVISFEETKVNGK
jgi:hypothetical protein